MDKNKRIAPIAFGLIAMRLLSGCDSGMNTPPPVISVSFADGNSQTIGQGQSVTITAVVVNDPSSKGVTWTLTGTGTLAKQRSTSVEYEAPTVVASNMTATVTATAVADPAKSGLFTLTITPAPPISVSVSPASASVAVNVTQDFMATIQNDAANAGVTWTLTQNGTPCSPSCGSSGPTTTASGELVTYTAPATTPANPTVALTATSVTDTTKSASATITVTPLPISVVVSPDSVLLGVNVTQQFTATVKNDGANKGVTWAPTQSGATCSPTCGNAAPTSTASGQATTYTAPSTVPTNPAIAIVATSVSDTGKTGGAAITLTNGTVKLAPAKVSFGRVLINTVKSINITLTNTGSDALTITSILVNGGQPSVFSQVSACGETVAAAASCIITVSFKPTSANLYAATLAITDSSTDSPQQIKLSGKGSTTATAAVQAALAASPTVAAPSPTGPSSVGTRVILETDLSRRDPYAPSVATRELLVRFWYPASLTEGCKPAEYTSPRVWSHFSDLIGVRLPQVTTNSCLDAPVADGQHPVVVFTHGYTGTFTDYTFLFEDLASRGYVVASIDHTYEATAVEFPDGRFVESIPGSHFGRMSGNDESELAFAVSVRLDDLKFVVSELTRLNNAPRGPFSAKLDLSRIALAGHSLGGVTALLGLEADPRVKAAVILDSVALETPAKPLASPVMLLAAGREQWSDQEQSVWEQLRGPRLAVNFLGCEHVTQSDLVWLARGAVKSGSAGPEKTIAAMRDYVAAFLDANLRGGPMDRILAGSPSGYPDAVVTIQAEPLCSKK